MSFMKALPVGATNTFSCAHCVSLFRTRRTRSAGVRSTLSATRLATVGLSGAPATLRNIDVTSARRLVASGSSSGDRPQFGSDGPATRAAARRVAFEVVATPVGSVMGTRLRRSAPPGSGTLSSVAMREMTRPPGVEPETAGQPFPEMLERVIGRAGRPLGWMWTRGFRFLLRARRRRSVRVDGADQPGPVRVDVADLSRAATIGSASRSGDRDPPRRSTTSPGCTNVSRVSATAPGSPESPWRPASAWRSTDSPPCSPTAT